jgi:hypothetical protein
MQHKASWEMTPDLNGRYSWKYFFGLTSDESALNGWTCLAVQPGLILNGNVYWAIKNSGPLEVCRVVVWVRDDNRFQPS